MRLTATVCWHVTSAQGTDAAKASICLSVCLLPLHSHLFQTDTDLIFLFSTNFFHIQLVLIYPHVKKVCFVTTCFFCPAFRLSNNKTDLDPSLNPQGHFKSVQNTSRNYDPRRLFIVIYLLKMPVRGWKTFWLCYSNYELLQCMLTVAALLLGCLSFIKYP